MNTDVFTDADFAPAETTDKPESAEVSLTDEAISQSDNTPLTQELLELETGEKMALRQPTPLKQLSPQPGCSRVIDPHLLQQPQNK